MEMIKLTDVMHKARKQRNCLLHPTPNPYPFLLPNTHTHFRRLSQKELSSQEPRVEGWVDCGAEMISGHSPRVCLTWVSEGPKG